MNNNIQAELEPEAAAENAAFELVTKCVLSYTQILGQTYGFTKDAGKQGLEFEESGYARTMSIFGYIVGLAEGGHLEPAKKLARMIVQQFDYLAGYGGTFEAPMQPYADGSPRRPMTFPRYIVRLSDDGTRHGYNVLWYINCSQAEHKDRTGGGVHPNRGLIKKWGFDNYYYRMTMNGGLLYHGHGDNSLACIFGSSSNLWSIHT